MSEINQNDRFVVNYRILRRYNSGGLLMIECALVHIYYFTLILIVSAK